MIEVEDPQRDLIDPAVKGTNNVLSSVAKHKTVVKRTIVTSSVAGRACIGQACRCLQSLQFLLSPGNFILTCNKMYCSCVGQ